MDNSNDNAEVATVETGDTDTKQVVKADVKADAPEYRPKLSDEEQLAVLEGRAKRIRSKLGIKDEAPKDSSAPDNLSEKAFLRAASISHAEDVELALELAKKWEMPLDKLVDDEDFIVKLEKQRTKRDNIAASADVKGGTGGSEAKNTAAYWIAKGTPPTAADVPDRATRAAITRQMIGTGKNGKKFYSD